MNVRRNTGTNN